MWGKPATFTNALFAQTHRSAEQSAFQYRTQNAPDDLTAKRRPDTSRSTFGHRLANRLAPPAAAAGTTRARTHRFKERQMARSEFGNSCRKGLLQLVC